MKTSSRLIRCWLGVVLLFTAGLIVRLGIFAFYEQPDFVQFSEADEKQVTRTLAHDDFDVLSLEGFWKVSIARGDAHAVTIKAGEEMHRRMSVARDGSTLRIRQEYFPLGSMDQAELRVTMPALKALRVRGGNEIDLSGFQDLRTALEVNGVNELTGSGCSIETLELSGVGGMGVNLAGCRVVNADLDLTGLGEVILTMAGGSLTGRINPEIDLVHEGPVSRKTIAIREMDAGEEAGKEVETKRHD